MSYLGEDRRKEDVLLTYIKESNNSVKDLLKTEIGSLRTEVKGLENKLSQQLKNHEVISMDKIEALSDEIECVKDKIKSMDERVEKLEEAPDKKKAAWVNKFFDVFMKVVYTAIATGAVAFIIYLIKQYLIS